MNWAQRGFTVVEVMLALAISGAILAASITIFSGSRRDTTFNQAVYDLQSKFNSYVNQVSNKVLPGYQSYSCVAAGAPLRPVISAASGTDETTKSDCVYLGQVIQVINTTGTNLYSYPVFALRTVSGQGPFDYPQTISSASPDMAWDTTRGASGGPYAALTDTYPLLGNLKTLSAQINGGEKDLVAYYSNLFESNTSGNEVTPYTYAKTFDSVSDVSSTWSTIRSCVTGSDAGCTLSAMSNKVWKLCVSDGSQSAILNIFATATGANTNVSIKTTSDCT